MRGKIIGKVITVSLFLLSSYAGALFVFFILRAFFPGISTLRFFTAHILLNLTLPLAYVLPRGRITKAIGMFSNYWMCLQFSMVFAAGPAAVLYAGLVMAFRLVSGQTFLYLSLGLLILVLMLTVYGFMNAAWVGTQHFSHRIAKPGVPGALRIVHLSDLHLGFVNDLRAVKRLVRKVNALKPDLVCITGDTFTENLMEVYDIEETADALRGIKSTYGLYGCLGNHDSGNGLPEMMHFFTRAGVHILEDAQATLPNGVVLAGRSDLTPGGTYNHARPPLTGILRGTDPAAPIVVMDHQPAAADETQAAGADLLLCGHTHGGQFFPVHLLVYRMFPHFYGAKYYDDLLMLVSPGTLTALPPMRIGSHSEIFVVELSWGTES